MTLRERLDREHREFEARRRWYEKWIIRETARIIDAKLIELAETTFGAPEEKR